MRFMVKKYADGRMVAFETTDDGSQVVRRLFGTGAEPGARLQAFVEVSFEESEEGTAAALDALHRLTEEVSGRKEALVRPRRRAR
jgi:hypothetical protein